MDVPTPRQTPRQFEQTESQLGYSLDLAEEPRRVCPDCIADEGLRRFVATNGQIQRCGFCGAASAQGVRLGALFHYMGRFLQAEWALAVDDLNVADGDDIWQSSKAVVCDTSDLLGHLGEPLANDELRAAFVGAFQKGWVPRHALRPAHHQVLADSWRVFTRYVKEESRYLFLSTDQGARGGDELIGPGELLDQVAAAIENGGLIRKLPAGAQLVRARQHTPEEVLATPKELGSPPRERATANRMSPPGISMFYGADDVDTALAELGLRSTAQLATVATWITARPLRFLDLVEVDVPSLFDPTAHSLRPWLRFLAGFAADVAKPVTPSTSAVDYVPTQVFTEYVRHLLGDRDDPVRGIRYGSAARSGGVSWVLFVDPGGCTEIAPNWEADPERWLGLKRTSLRRFRSWSWTEVE